MPDTFPNAYFGSLKKARPDWRAEQQDDTPDDDEELAETPPDVIAMLGFDPRELGAEEDEFPDRFSDDLSFDEFRESEHPRGQPGNAGQFGPGGGGSSEVKKSSEITPSTIEGQSKNETGRIPVSPYNSENLSIYSLENRVQDKIEEGKLKPSKLAPVKVDPKTLMAPYLDNSQKPRLLGRAWGSRPVIARTPDGALTIIGGQQLVDDSIREGQGEIDAWVFDVNPKGSSPTPTPEPEPEPSNTGEGPGEHGRWSTTADATPDEKESATQWGEQHSLAVPLNKWLRDPEYDPKNDGWDFSRDDLKKAAANLQSLVNKSTLTKDTTVYRGVKSPGNLLKQGFKPGDTIDMRGFTATSMNKNRAENVYSRRGGLLMAIHAPAGTHAFEPLLHMTRDQDFDQQELVFGPGKFRIGEYDKATNTLNLYVEPHSSGDAADSKYEYDAATNTLYARDEFNEADHPRGQPGNAGQFTSGSGGGGATPDPDEVPAVVKRIETGSGYKNTAERIQGAERLIKKNQDRADNTDDPKEKKSALSRVKELKAALERLKEKLEEEQKGGGGPEPEKPKPPEPKPPPKPAPPPQPPEPRAAPVEIKPASTARTAEGKKVMADAIAAKTLDKEKEWHRAGTWNNATDEFSYALAGVQPLRQVKSGMDARTAFYQRPDHRIHMSRYKQGGSRSDTVWRHEYGHAMDANGNIWFSSERYLPEIREEAEALIKNRDVKPSDQTIYDDTKIGDDDVTEYLDFVRQGAKSTGQLSPEEMRRLAGIKQLIETGRLNYGHMPSRGDWAGRVTEDYNFFDDFVASMTECRIGRGHGKAYYHNNPARVSGEMFANYVALTQGPKGDVYRKLLHSIAPKSCAGFDRIISDRAAAGRKKMGHT